VTVSASRMCARRFFLEQCARSQQKLVARHIRQARIKESGWFISILAGPRAYMFGVLSTLSFKQRIINSLILSLNLIPFTTGPPREESLRHYTSSVHKLRSRGPATLTTGALDSVSTVHHTFQKTLSSSFGFQ